MQPYQTYLNYPNQPMQQMYNPYAESRFNNLQQFQQSLQPPTQQPAIMTRIVTDFSTLTANDVPMQGGAFFVKADGTEIEHREWSASGQIIKKSYKAILDDLNLQTIKSSNKEEKTKFATFNEVLGVLENKVDTLNDKIEELLKQKPTSKSRKEVVADE